jgi:hypothetical protein
LLSNKEGFEVYKTEKELRELFVIMPFTKTETRNQRQLTSFFNTNIKKAIENGLLNHQYRVWRSGERFNITDEIIRDLYRADIVIADLSGVQPNPNVMYELGVRLAVSDKPVILIREQSASNMKVFDVDSYYIFQYDPFAYCELETHLVDKIRRFETNQETFKSPIHKVLHDLMIPDWSNREIDGIKELEKIRSKLQLFTPKQFATYQKVWINLVMLKSFVDVLWRSPTSKNISMLEKQLKSADQIVNSSAIYMEADHIKMWEDIRKPVREFLRGKELHRAIRLGRLSGSISSVVDSNEQRMRMIADKLEILMDAFRKHLGG